MKNWMWVAAVGGLGAVLLIFKPWRPRAPSAGADGQPTQSQNAPGIIVPPVSTMLEAAMEAITGNRDAASRVGDSAERAESNMTARIREAREGTGELVASTLERIEGESQRVFRMLGL